MCRLKFDQYAKTTYQLGDEYERYIMKWIERDVKKLNLVYRSSRDTFKISELNKRARGVDIFIIMKTSYNKIIGGFQTAERQKYESFLFSLSRREKYSFFNKCKKNNPQ